MPEKRFRASLLVGNRVLGNVQGEIDQVTEGGAIVWQGHFEWLGTPGLLMAAHDLRLKLSDADGDRLLRITAHTRQVAPADQPPFRFDFRSTDDPSPIDERLQPGELPLTMQDDQGRQINSEGDAT